MPSNSKEPFTHRYALKKPCDTHVIVGMSGGVDSSIAALLLKQAGYRVTGLFMRNWEELDGSCTSEDDFQDVRSVCDHLEIPYYSVDFVKEYRDKVFAEFLKDLKSGHTPNPDILCNREIKFNVFFRKAMDLGADFLATGHYCQTDGDHLYKGADPSKDQSYFLGAMPKKALKKVLFPIGHLEKDEVRKIAKSFGVSTWKKKDSTGICFIGERNFRNFLKDYIPYQPGPFCSMDGKVVGQHLGVAFYTLGQRRGLALGGPGQRWYVTRKDISTNTVYVHRGIHPTLYRTSLACSQLSFFDAPPEVGEELMCKIRYRQKDQTCRIKGFNENTINVEFSDPQWAITTRQAVVFYRGDRCIGSGFIH